MLMICFWICECAARGRMSNLQKNKSQLRVVSCKRQNGQLNMPELYRCVRKLIQASMQNEVLKLTLSPYHFTQKRPF